MKKEEFKAKRNYKKIINLLFLVLSAVFVTKGIILMKLGIHSGQVMILVPPMLLVILVSIEEMFTKGMKKIKRRY